MKMNSRLWKWNQCRDLSATQTWPNLRSLFATSIPLPPDHNLAHLPSKSESCGRVRHQKLYMGKWLIDKKKWKLEARGGPSDFNVQPTKLSPNHPNILLPFLSSFIGVIRMMTNIKLASKLHYEKSTVINSKRFTILESLRSYVAGVSSPCFNVNCVVCS
jgi:hypothetical protein